MIVCDYECQECGYVQETFITTMKRVPQVLTCVKCGGTAKRIISLSRTNHGVYNEDSGWLKSVREVVDKDPKKAHCQAFIKNPTRTNYKNWMRGEGIRPLEPGEKSRPTPVDTNVMAEKVMKRRREREAISA